jgi:hypothetical protein
MTPLTDIVGAFRIDLVAAGLVRRPSEAAPDAPPLHIEPADGAPAPGEREGVEDDDALVLSVFVSELAETNFDGALRRRAILELRYRPFDQAALMDAQALDAAIRARLLDPARNYGYGFDLGGIYCHQATPFAGLSTIARARGNAGAGDLSAKWMLEAHA